MRRSPRSFPLSPVLVLALLAAGTACDRAGPATVSVGEPDDGVPTTVVRAESLAAAPRLVLTEETRIGGDSAAGTRFTNIAGIALSSRAEIFVIDAAANDVRVFDERGRLVRRFSRPGPGPGEMQSPRAVTMGGDTLFVMDRRGVQRFAADGRFLGRGAAGGETFAVPGGGTPGTVFYQGITYTTRGLVTAAPRSYPPAHAPRGAYHDTLGLHVLSPFNGHLMTAFTYVVSPERLWVVDLPGELEGSAAPFYHQPWFAPATLSYTAAPDGRVYVARHDGVSIDVLSLRIPPSTPSGAGNAWRDGAAPARIRLGVPRRHGTDSELEDLLSGSQAQIQAVLQRLSEQPGAPPPSNYSAVFDAWRKLPQLEYVPVVGTLLALQSGDLLVQRTDLSPGNDVSPGPTVWDLLGADGQVRGQVELPSLFTPMLLRDEHLLGVQRDSLDVPLVVQYRLQLLRIEPPVTLQTPTTR